MVSVVEGVMVFVVEEEILALQRVLGFSLQIQKIVQSQVHVCYCHCRQSTKKQMNNVEGSSYSNNRFLFFVCILKVHESYLAKDYLQTVYCGNVDELCNRF